MMLTFTPYVAEEVARKKAQAAEDRRLRAVEADRAETERFTADVMKQVRADEKAKLVAAGNAAAKEYREQTTFDCAMQCGPIRVDWTFGTVTDPAYRGQLYQSITTALSRLHLWFEDGAITAKAHAMGKNPERLTPAERVAALLSDDLRGLIARGLVQVSVEQS